MPASQIPHLAAHEENREHLAAAAHCTHRSLLLGDITRRAGDAISTSSNGAADRVTENLAGMPAASNAFFITPFGRYNDECMLQRQRAPSLCWETILRIILAF